MLSGLTAATEASLCRVIARCRKTQRLWRMGASWHSIIFARQTRLVCLVAVAPNTRTPCAAAERGVQVHGTAMSHCDVNKHLLAFEKCFSGRMASCNCKNSWLCRGQTKTLNMVRPCDTRIDSLECYNLQSSYAFSKNTRII